MIRSLAIIVALTAASSALAQANTTSPQPNTAPQPSYAQPNTASQPSYAQPNTAPQPSYAQPPPQQAVPMPSQGTGSAASQAQPTAPSAAGGGSQQVVVNPPAQQPAAPPPAPAPAPSVTVQSAPSAVPAQGSPMVVERETGRPTLEIVAIDAAYGALAGALVGGGVALIDQGNNLGRNLLIGAGAGILVGAAVGGVQAYGASRSSYAMDGLSSPDRDPPLASAHTVVSYAGRF